MIYQQFGTPISATGQPMTNTDPRSRFAPGAGMPPPVMAGRDREKALFVSAFQGLEKGVNPAANIALIGPRGNGKTVLLRWAQSEVSSRGGKLNFVNLKPHQFETLPKLVQALASPGIFKKLAGDGFSVNINVLGTGIGVARQQAAEILLEPVLRKRCAECGFVILIDEAHMLDRRPDISREFFNEVQSVASEGLPLLVILAGTPDMSPRLNMIEATFWNRLEKVGIGLLDFEASRQALEEPLKQLDYCIEKSALDRAVEAAQCYPYFLQLVGQELHRAATAEPSRLKPGGVIGDDILELALQNSRTARETYYAERYRELRSRCLLPTAVAVAEIFRSDNATAIAAAAFEDAVSGSVDANLKKRAKASGAQDAALWAEDELRNLGFIWSQIGEERYCEPGIPSLMDYVVELSSQRRNDRRR